MAEMGLEAGSSEDGGDAIPLRKLTVVCFGSLGISQP